MSQHYRSGGEKLSYNDMLSYGFKPREPWAEDKRALERAFDEAKRHARQEQPEVQSQSLHSSRASTSNNRSQHRASSSSSKTHRGSSRNFDSRISSSGYAPSLATSSSSSSATVARNFSRDVDSLNRSFSRLTHQNVERLNSARSSRSATSPQYDRSTVHSNSIPTNWQLQSIASRSSHVPISSSGTTMQYTNYAPSSRASGYSASTYGAASSQYTSGPQYYEYYAEDSDDDYSTQAAEEPGEYVVESGYAVQQHHGDYYSNSALEYVGESGYAEEEYASSSEPESEGSSDSSGSYDQGASSDDADRSSGDGSLYDSEEALILSDNYSDAYSGDDDDFGDEDGDDDFDDDYGYDSD